MNEPGPDRLKIVHAAPSLYRGGGERLMIELANGQIEAGHEVTVLLGFHIAPEFSHKGLDPRVEVRVIAPEGVARGRHYRPLLPWLWRNRRWLAEQDVLHCHMTFAALLGTAIKAMTTLTGSGRPAMVETYHAVGMPISGMARWTHARMAAGRDALAFMVEHPYWRAFLNRHPGIPARIIPAGVAIEDDAAARASRRAETRARIGIPEDAIVLGTVGRLFAERKPWIYMPIFARVAEALGPRVHFLMGGDGPEMPRIRAQRAECGLEGRVHLPGVIEDLPAAFAAMDLYTTLNIGPVPGVSGLQAVGAGLPVLSYQIAPDYARGGEDWIWSSRDPDRVAERAIGLLRDAAARADLAGRQHAHLVEHHSAEAMLRSYAELYREAIRRRDRRS